MGANVGQAVFNVVGLVVSAYYPLAGAAIAAAGQAIFPTKLPPVTGPRAQDEGITTSQIGYPIPIVAGAQKTTGNVIWAAPRKEIVNDDSTGKGGPSQKITTYSYTRSYSVLLCANQITGVRRIWRNAKLIYDRSVRAAQETDDDYAARTAMNEAVEKRMRIYIGAADQLPCPVQESYLGVGNAPAYRGRAYVTFEDEDITDLGGRIPGLEFEVVEVGSVLTDITVERSNDVLYPWINSIDPRACKNDHEYRYGTSPWRASLLEAQADAMADGKSALRMATLIGWSADGIVLNRADTSLQPGELEMLYLHLNSLDFDGEFHKTLADAASACEALAGSDIAKGTTIWWSGLGISGPGPGTPGWYVVHDSGIHPAVDAAEDIIAAACAAYPPTLSPPRYYTYPGYGGKTYTSAGAALGAWKAAYWPEATSFTGEAITDPSDSTLGSFDGTYQQVGEWQFYICATPPDSGTSCGTYEAQIYMPGTLPSIGVSPDTIVQVRRKVRAPDNPCLPRCADAYPTLPENADYCVIGNSITRSIGYTLVEGSYKALQNYSTTGSPTTVRYPLGPVVISGSTDDNSAAWSAAYAAAVTAGMMPPDLVYGVDYPQAKAYAYEREFQALSLEPTPRQIQDVVLLIAERCGMSAGQLDISALTESIWGMRLAQLMTGRDAIEQLQRYGYFDCVEVNGVLAFPLRGGATVATLGEDDLGAYMAGDEAPPLASAEQTETLELPKTLRIHYDDLDGDYQAGAQSAERQLAGSSSSTDLEFAIAMDGTKAAQMAEVLLAEAWANRETYTLNVSPAKLALMPGDPIFAPIEGQQQRMRIISKDMPIPFGVVKATAVRDDASVYTSYHTGPKPPFAPSRISITGPTNFLLIDGPALTQSNDDAGLYVAVNRVFSGWHGAVIQRSTDSGASWTNVASLSASATIGVTLDALPDGPVAIPDSGNTLTVRLSAGSLQSVTEAQLLRYANLAFVGAGGRWELLQFRDAEHNMDGSWTLSGLLRGRRGTEWTTALHEAGEHFVLVNAALGRITLGTAAISADASYRAVSFGVAADGTDSAEFITVGTALECYAPSGVRASRNNDGDLQIVFSPRSRLGPEWIDNADVPLNESIERYELDVLDVADAVLRTLSATTPAFTVTAAQQVADFGSLQSLMRVDIYQLSAAAGRGHPLRTSL